MYLFLSFLCCVFSAAIAVTRPDCEQNLANFLRFPIVTDFGVEDCDTSQSYYYNPTLYCGKIPGCEQISTKPGGVCTDICPPGHKCTGGRCAVDEDSCWKYYYGVDYKDTRWNPTCRNDGTWEPKQCKGDRCFCFDGKGTRIFGTAFSNQAANMTCACSRKRAELEEDPNNYFVTLHCDDMGNYEPLQCLNGQCWCAEPKTGEMLTPTVSEKMMTRLPCYEGKVMGSQYLRRCESQLYAQEKIRDEFTAHGTLRTSFPFLRCLYDGSFGPTRIENGIISCVWRDNTAIGYAADLAGAVIADIDCHCARDVKIFEAVGLQQLRTCLANGNYDPLQRDGDDYYCVDSDGFRISSITQKELTREDCMKMK